jgi:hypothetical protein
MTAILNNAEQFAKSFIPEEALNSSQSQLAGTNYPSQNQTIKHHYHYYNSPWSSYWLWPRHSYVYEPIYVCPTSLNRTCRSFSTATPNKSPEKKDDNTLMIAAIAAIVTVVASYFAGKVAGTFSQLNQHLTNLASQKQTVAEGSKLEKVIKIEEKMVNDIKKSTKTGFMLTGILATSASIAALGATLYPSVLAGGLAAFGMSGAAHLVRRGFLDADTTQREDAAELLSTIKEARAEIKA